MRPASRRMVASNASLLRTAGSLLGTTIVTSGLGFVYWWAAARLLPVGLVGYGSSLINAMTLIGTFGMLGLGTMLIGELQGGRRSNPGLVSAGLVLSGVVSGIGGAAVLVVLASFAKAPFDDLGIARTCWFAAGCGLTASSLVLDLAFVGAGAGGVQLLRNALFAAIKLAVLPVLIFAGGKGSELPVLVAWVLASLVSLAVLARPAARRAGLLGRPDWRELHDKRRSTAAHNALNVASQVPRLTLPIVATTAISPADGAAFFVAWMIVGFLFVIPTHLSTALFALGAGQLVELRRKITFSLRTSAAFGALAVPLVALIAHPAMVIFGARYADIAAASLPILVLSYFPTIIKTHYAAVVRVQGRLAFGAVLASLGAALEVGAAWLGARAGGLDGMVIGSLVGISVEALVMLPTVLGAMRSATRQPRRGGRHRGAGYAPVALLQADGARTRN
jgi:O-antigen/teichoic acid export membrane protein